MAKKKKKVTKAAKATGPIKPLDITKIGQSADKTINQIAPSTGVNANRPDDKPGEQWVECRCFECNGDSEKCNLCGEAASVCQCGDNELEPCGNCNGTGKSRRLVSSGENKK